MAARFRLLALPGPTTDSIRFALAWPAPDEGDEAPCAPAELDAGDGYTFDLGLTCAPTSVTWQEGRLIELITHRYAGPGPHQARLRWGAATAVATVPPPAVAETPPVTADVSLFQIVVPRDRPAARLFRVQVKGLAREQQVRLDGGAGQVFRLAAPTGADQTAEWTLAYPKPGVYRVVLDLLDEQGFWIANLTEAPIEMIPASEKPGAVPVTPSAAPAMLPPATVPQIAPADLAPAAAEAQPWLPYRYARPVWAGARTYTAPGSGQVNRVVDAGFYLSIRGETTHQGAIWYLTAGGDWIAAKDVTLFVTSELRGVQLGEPAPPPPPPPPEPPPTRRGIVITAVLNVRGRPGVYADNPPIDQLVNGTEIGLYEEATDAGAIWYRIGVGRWVHSGYVRIIERGATAAARTAPPTRTARAAAPGHHPPRDCHHRGVERPRSARRAQR